MCLEHSYRWKFLKQLNFSFLIFISGTPEECLTPLVSHPLDDLKFIDSGLGGQVRIHLSIHGTHVPQVGTESSFP